jgi:hypothetical protein
VTVSEKGLLYAINAEKHLKVFIWDDASNDRTPETGSGKILATGWNQYDLLVAAGDGTLYARKPNGELFVWRIPTPGRTPVGASASAPAPAGTTNSMSSPPPTTAGSPGGKARS